MNPESHAVAAEAVAKQAYELNREYEGCKALSGFLPHGALLDFLGDAFCPPSGLKGKALSFELAHHFQENDLAHHLVKGLLENLSLQSGNKSQDLAIRILQQIRSDQAAGPTYRKPLHYIAGTEEGLAFAVVIDNRFWTDEW